MSLSHGSTRTLPPIHLGRCRSAVLGEADLLGLLAELLALHHDAVLADQGHAAEAAGDARGAVALGAGKAADRGGKGVPRVVDSRLAAADHGSVSGGEEDLHRLLSLRIVSLQGVAV